MNTNGLKLGRVFGIDVSLEIGVIPLIVILNVLLATSVLPRSVPGHVPLTYWTVALVVAILFVASLLAHEMAHSLVANRYGISVKGIVLWLFGGISQLESEPETPGAEFAIAISGPLASTAVGALSIAASWSLSAVGAPPIYVVALQWLGIVNVVLGVFNLLPGTPLDGGRVLASAVWKVRKSRIKGQIAAAMVGRFLGIGLAAFGVYDISTSGTWFGVWNIGLGLMLHQSARYQERFLRLEQSLGDRTVKDLMDSQPRSASALATISQAVETTLSSGHQSALPILDWSGHVVALVELAELYAIPEDRWGNTTALAATRTDQEFLVATPGEKVVDLLERMTQLRRRHAAVVVDGDLVGLIGPEQLVEEAKGDRTAGGR